MAQVILTAVGSIFGRPGALVGGILGAVADQAIIGSLTPPRHGPRIADLRITGTAEGGPMAIPFGRVRVPGQMIWAARFKEARVEHRTGGGKGGPRVVEFKYSLSFAVALCEGPIDGIGKVWADGKPLNLTEVTMRVYRGMEDQTPDPLIEAVEGSAPAYRGCAYVVFEDLALDRFGNRPPQLSFEVFRRARPSGATGLEDRLQGVCLIPGAGEFVYATETVLRRQSLVKIVGESVNNAQGRPDLLVSLDQLAAQAPNVKSVMLVVSWFGTDLRLSHCEIKPGIDRVDKFHMPSAWSVAGQSRASAHLISTSGAGPAYGGTPSDETVVQAIRELKARGYNVGLYPFILMDVPAGNSLPNPPGGTGQPAYPWRGRITCHPAPGVSGTVDKTGGAATQMAHFFGTAAAGDFGEAAGAVTYSGPAEWGLNRMVLHYARLAQIAGGVDTLLIGSELRGVTTVRSGGLTYPAVPALKSLAGQVRAIVGGGTAVSYAADWTEYFGHQPADGTGDVHFHLDPLWSDANVNFVGVDWYPPLADWREGDVHLDVLAGYGGPHDPAYLAANVAGGEGFDYFYASPAARNAQTRTAITDGAYGEPWVFRPKDLKSWWTNTHYNRPGGVRSASATDWVPQSKPIRLIEFGCPAVDKGANAPNLFVDPKSAESSLPPFSTGARDDNGQRLALEAILTHFDDPAHNPVSTVYGEPMLASDALHAWCWDARPFPDFPARTALWADAANWALGHWLNGRAGSGPVADLIGAIADLAGVQITTDKVRGLAAGYLVDRPMRVADALSPLARAFGLEGAERGGGIALVARSGVPATALSLADLALPDNIPGPATRRVLIEPPDILRVRFIDAGTDYQTGAAVLRRDPATGAGPVDLDLPIVLERPEAEAAGRRIFDASHSARNEVTVHVSPLAALRAEPGDILEVETLTGGWRVVRTDMDETPRLTLAPADSPPAAIKAPLEWTLPPAGEPAGPPAFLLVDLPGGSDARPLAAISVEPWRAMDVAAGASPGALTIRGRADQPATLGETLSDFPAGRLWRVDENDHLDVLVEGETLQTRPLAEVLAGANAAAVRNADGDWEVIQFVEATLIGPNTYRLARLLRGQSGSDAAMAPLTVAGAPFVLLTPDLVRLEITSAERDLPLTLRAAPAGGPPGGLAMTETAFTWRALALRPWSPAHLSLAADGPDLTLAWIRRARLHGDGWETEPPLSEEIERYRVEVLDGADVVRTAEAAAPVWTYPAADQLTDFGGPAPLPLTVRVSQWSAVVGWGASATRSLRP